MTNSRSILIGFGMMALALVFGPDIRAAVIPHAQAHMDTADYRMVNRGLSDIASAISGLRACND